MTDDDAILGFINRCEVSSDLWLHAECTKEIRCDVNSLDALGSHGSVKVDGKRSPRGNALESLTLLAKIEDVGRVEKGATNAEGRVSIGQPHNSIGISVWQ